MDILKWLKQRGYQYTWNFRIGTRTPDLIAFNDREVIVFEFKRYATELSNALGQCLFYRKKTNKSFIVLGHAETSRLQSSSLQLLKKYGVGLISVNENVKIVIDSKFSKFSDERLFKALKSKSIDSTTYSTSRMVGEEVKQKIINTLKENPQGLHILGISRLVGAHRHTVTKYIYEMIGAGSITVREIGTVKICVLNEVEPVKTKRSSK